MKIFIPSQSGLKGGQGVWVKRFSREIEKRGFVVTNQPSNDCVACLHIGRYTPPAANGQASPTTGFRVANGYDPQWFQIMQLKMGPEHHLVNSSIALGLKEADVVIYQSSWAKSQLDRMFGKPNGRSTMIHNAVDLTQFNPSRKVSLDVPVLGMAGAFRYKYRLQTFLDMSSRLRIPHKLLLVGSLDHDSTRVLNLFSKDPENFGKIEYHEYQSDSDLPGFYNRMSLLVHPVIGDVCPNVVCEALACGVPIVAPNIGGTAEIIGKGGVIFESELWIYDHKFVAAMTRAVEIALGSQNRLSSLARKQAEDHLDLNIMVDRYLQALGLPLTVARNDPGSLHQAEKKKNTIKKWLAPTRYYASLIIRKGSRFKNRLVKPVVKRRPRIAFTLFDFQIGGIENWLYRLAKYLREEFDFYFITTTVEEILPKFKEIGECAYLPDPVKMIRFLQKNHIDIVQVHNERWPVDAALAAGVPIVIERLGGPRSWLRVPKYGMNMVIASSRMAATALEGSVEPSRIRTIYNGIDLDEVDQTPINRLFPEDTFVIGRTSRFGHGQNIAMLIEALAIMIAEYPQLRLVLVGSDSPLPGARPVLKELKLLAEEKNISPYVHFTGNVPEPLPLIKGFDIGTCVSNDEGIPNSLIEAMACRKPVIATNVGAISELISHRKNGILISPDNVEQLVEAIELLINDEYFYQEMASAGRETIEKKFNIITSSQRYAALYHELIG